MDLATAIVLVLGLIFFGGIIYLGWREQKKAKVRETVDASRVNPSDSRREEVARQRRSAR